MSQPLPGMHYCRDHQGNHSHYDPCNCIVCRQHKAIMEVYSLVDADGVIQKGPVLRILGDMIFQVRTMTLTEAQRFDAPTDLSPNQRGK